MIPNYDAVNQEPEIMAFWKNHSIYEKSQKEECWQTKVLLLDVTVHLRQSSSWNCVEQVIERLCFKIQKNERLRCMGQGRVRYARAPLQNRLLKKKLGLKNKDEIPNYGIANFVNECREFSTGNLLAMNEDFKRIGVWMDFENPYMSINNSYMEGEWWLVKKAFENKRLYEGEKTMHWCFSCATSLAKHELEYESINDASIFVKFQLKHKQNEFLVIWTTTPWTIPFNLGVMVNPNIDYIRAKVGNETWIVARDLAETFITRIAGKEFSVLSEFKGNDLLGMEYVHPFADEIARINEIKAKHPKALTVVMSEEYVDTTSGSGLVHMAPGCGTLKIMRLGTGTT